MTDLLAGAAKVDITPPTGVYLDGYYGRVEPSQGIHDNLFARAVYLSDGNNSVAVVVCDLCWVSQQLVNATNEVLYRRGVSVDHVILCATHTHSGPAIVDLLAPLNDLNLGYLRELPVRLADAIQNGLKRARPASLQIARGDVNLSINRRKSRGFVDREVVTISVIDSSGRPIAKLVNYACHGTVLGPDNLLISADYPGVLAASIESSSEGDLTCLFLNGACGDINPYTCTGYTCTGDFADVKAIGAALSDCSASSKETRRINTSGGVRFHSVKLGPLQPLGMELGFCVVNVGNLIILAVPGEVFAQTGLALKNASSNADTVVVGYANGYQGYLPTEDAFVQGNSEASSLCWVTATAESELRRTGAEIIAEVLRVQNPGPEP